MRIIYGNNKLAKKHSLAGKIHQKCKKRKTLQEFQEKKQVILNEVPGYLLWARF